VALARRLFTGTVDERVVDLLSAMVRGRWSKAVDLVSALHDLGIEAILAGAHAGGSAEEIEQQLFEVHEQIADNRELREALTPSRRTGTEARVRLAEAVFAPHISAPAMSLVDWCVRHHAEGGPLRNLRRVVELAAEMRQRTIVDVVTAIPMTSAQEERLRTILERRLGTRIDLNCEVDPTVIGGARISTRNYVMDRTVRSAVAELRTRLAG
jgi:ATP synthase F1, delta subunit